MPSSPKATLNPYLKKWTCIHCNYSNDSLKVVCLNCRWVKTSTATSAVGVSSLNSTVSTLSNDSTLSGAEADATPTKHRRRTSESNNNNNNSFCASCKSPLHESTLSAPKKDEKSSFFVSDSTEKPKWNCATCLAPNVESSDKCVCCSASKPAVKVAEKETSSASATTTTLQTLLTKPTLSLSGAAPKWTCSACLVNNETDKLKCVCCQTDKPVATTATPNWVIKGFLLYIVLTFEGRKMGLNCISLP